MLGFRDDHVHASVSEHQCLWIDYDDFFVFDFIIFIFIDDYDDVSGDLEWFQQRIYVKMEEKTKWRLEILGKQGRVRD